MAKRLFLWLSGGRPMTFVSHCFTDVVNGRQVNFYRDQYGRSWLAHSAWARFRVEPNYGPEIWERAS